jgi:hypothetical protein
MNSFATGPVVVRVIAAAVTLSLAGCPATTGPLQKSSGDEAPAVKTAAAPIPAVQLTVSEQQMRKDSERFNHTVIGGVLMGAAAGGVGAAAITALTGGDSKQIRRNAITGAVVGGVVGGIDGYVTAKKEAAGNNEIRALQAATADVQQDNRKLQAFLDSSGQVLAEGKNRLAALRGDVAAKRVTAEQAEQARKREEQNIAAMNSTLTQAKTTRDQYTQASAKFSGTPQAKRDLDAEINRMNKQVAQLENNVSDYNRALAVSKA